MKSHGHTRGRKPTRTYRIWCNMLTRCTNPRSPNSRLYGARGIRVCERWRSFENFLDDMGEAPADHSIDRIDNNADYYPGNCRWATRAQQSRNTRRNRMITINGRTECLEDWGAFAGLDPMTIKARLKRGCPTDRLLDPPQNSNAKRTHV